MPQPQKKTAPRSTDTCSKRLKSGLDVRSNEVRWSDLNYILISDIFSHLFTIQQLKCRRVSSSWNTMLLDHLSSSSDVSLRQPDLKYWQIIFCTPVQKTRLAMRARKVSLVTERTRRLIIDFARIDITYHSPYNNCFGCNDEYPLTTVGRYHPQISHIVLCRVFEPYFGQHSEQHLNVLSCLSDSMSNLSPNVRVTLCDVGFHCRVEARHIFSIPERTLMESWKMPWPNVTFKFVKESFDNLMRERSMSYWPYPSDQLTWLSNCFRMLPAEDILLRFMAIRGVKVDGYPDFDPPTFLTLRGNSYSRFILAFIARFLITFRQHLNLPPPPHPLIWSDSF